MDSLNFLQVPCGLDTKTRQSGINSGPDRANESEAVPAATEAESGETAPEQTLWTLLAIHAPPCAGGASERSGYEMDAEEYAGAQRCERGVPGVHRLFAGGWSWRFCARLPSGEDGC